MEQAPFEKYPESERALQRYRYDCHLSETYADLIFNAWDYIEAEIGSDALASEFVDAALHELQLSPELYESDPYRALERFRLLPIVMLAPIVESLKLEGTLQGWYSRAIALAVRDNENSPHNHECTQDSRDAYANISCARGGAVCPRRVVLKTMLSGVLQPDFKSDDFMFDPQGTRTRILGKLDAVAGAGLITEGEKSDMQRAYEQKRIAQLR